MRKGKEFYTENYDKVLELHKQGKTIKEIAQILSISYSAAYHWVKGIRKPSEGNLISFKKFLNEHGPMPAIEIAEKFPKHNEIFHVAKKRNIPIKRYKIKVDASGYNIWYYLKGQEKDLEKTIKEFKEKFKEVKEKLIWAMEESVTFKDNNI